MAWHVSVRELRFHVASCGEPGCGWDPSPRETEQEAWGDAAAHQREHDRRWVAYNVAVSRGASADHSRCVLAGQMDPPFRSGDRVLGPVDLDDFDDRVVEGEGTLVRWTGTAWIVAWDGMGERACREFLLTWLAEGS
jgi:hypothetical protein